MAGFRAARRAIFGALGCWASMTAAAGCAPKTVEEAEARGKVDWLAAQPSAAAVAALGRLADDDAKAREILARKAEEGSTSTFVAAWEATKRGAPWGPELLKGALARTPTAEKAALAMTRGDPHLKDFVADLDGAFVALEDKGARGLPVASLVASVGAAADRVVEERLRDGRTRGAMCQAIASAEASADARRVLFAVPPTSRDHVACMSFVLRRAGEDPAVLAWLGEQGEPGLLREAAEGSTLGCDVQKRVWATALAKRPPEDAAGLGIPLAAVLKRCPRELDAEVSRALRKQKALRTSLVSAVDSRAALGSTMPLTCIELAVLARSREVAFVRGRAAEAAEDGCRRR